MNFLIIYAIVWLISAIIIAGLHFAYFQGRFKSIAKENYKEDLSASLKLGIIGAFLGPIGVLLVLFLSEFAKYGWRLK